VISNPLQDCLLSAAFIKRLLHDQVHIRRSLWKSLIKRTQLKEEVPLFLDREREIIEYFHIPRDKLWAVYLTKGFPNTIRFRRYLDSFFKEASSSPLLKTAYAQAAFPYSVRLMLAFEEYSRVTKYLETLLALHKKGDTSLKTWSVLDYGCGVSDVGILLSLLGAQVTICDLDDQKLSFAGWRFQRRNLDVKVIAITENTQIPDFGKRVYDLIVATEILEHVPNPLRSLRALTESLKPGGLLFDSLGGRFDRKSGGDHLAEALVIGKSQNYQTFYKENYVPVVPVNGISYLFQKRNNSVT